jgi:RimJ/RimL family protein N-acetyltransferase
VSAGAAPAEIRTERLVLRRWREDDLESYAALLTDPVVRRYFERPLTHAEALEDAREHAEAFERNGFDLWIVERPGEAAFIGVTGVRRIPRAMPFKPLVDVGWLLLPEFWGRRYAAEAARAALHDAFTRADLDEVVAYTARVNEPSRKVMRQLGMTYDPAADFDHPSQSPASPVRAQVLYRLRREAFLTACGDEGGR